MLIYWFYVFKSVWVHLIINFLQPEILLVHAIAISRCVLKINMIFLQLFLSYYSLSLQLFFNTIRLQCQFILCSGVHVLGYFVTIL